MSTTPYDPAHTHVRATDPESVEVLSPLAPPQPTHGRGRIIALVGGIVAVVGLGGGAALAFHALGGGGAQPESVMPAGAMAFAKIDLDPSPVQKLDAVRFASKFPATRNTLTEQSDLGQYLVSSIQKDGALKGVDYAKDVKPWLGKRIGVGVLPGPSSSADPTVVVALAVSDQDAARKSLPKIGAAMDGAKCQLVRDYALCTQADRLAAVVAAVGRGALAESNTFVADMARLGEQGVASAWFDGGRSGAVMHNLAAKSGAALTADSTMTGGRGVMALRFDGPNLELVGHTTSTTSHFVGNATARTGITHLPKGTLVAVGIANFGPQLKAAWPALDKQIAAVSGGPQGPNGAMAQAGDALGIRIPDDLFAVVGSEFAVAFGGMDASGAAPRVGIVTNGSRAVLQKLVGAGQQADGPALALRQVGSTSVLALSADYADALARGSGLGAQDRFRAALPHADSARVAAYVDITGVVAAFKDQIPADTARQLAPLSAAGLTVTGDGTSGDFTLRLTTR